MTICSLGSEWKDPSKIPVNKIVEEWRKGRKRARYESAMWRTAGLQEPSSGLHSNLSSAHNDREMAAQGEEHAAFRMRMGWAPGEYSYRPGLRVIPAATPSAANAGASGSNDNADNDDDDDDDDDHNDDDDE